jgi:hypothetical protein
MVKLFFSALFFFSLSTQVLFADPNADKALIETTLSNFSDTWNSKDFQKIGTFFSFNADLIDPWGNDAKDKAKIIDLIKNYSSRLSADVKVDANLEEIRFLNNDNCLVDATFTFSKNLQEKEDKHAVFVFIRQNKEWKILAGRIYEFLKITPVEGDAAKQKEESPSNSSP